MDIGYIIARGNRMHLRNSYGEIIILSPGDMIELDNNFGSINLRLRDGSVAQTGLQSICRSLKIPPGNIDLFRDIAVLVCSVASGVRDLHLVENSQQKIVFVFK